MFFNKKRQKQALQQAKEQITDKVPASKGQLDSDLTDIANKSDKIVTEVKDVAEESVQHLSKHVKSKPIKAVVISTIVGYLLGRVTR